MSTGSEALAGLGVSLTEIAREVGSTKQAVSQWRAGKAVPTANFRRRLETAFGIPRGVWDGGARCPAAIVPGVATIPHLEDLLRTIHAKRIDPALTPSEFAMLAKSEGELIERLARAENLARGDVVKPLGESPQFLEFIATLEELLTPYPAALADVRAAIAEAVNAPHGAGEETRWTRR